MVSENSRVYSEEAGPEDGSDPRRFYDRRQRRAAPRKSLQLSAQVAEALRSILAGAADSRLHTVEVVQVQPSPNSGRLLVLVRTPHPEALPAATPYLRSEVAACIVRRKAPELVFEFVP